jgi:streptogramin lyase
MEIRSAAAHTVSALAVLTSALVAGCTSGSPNGGSTSTSAVRSSTGTSPTAIATVGQLDKPFAVAVGDGAVWVTEYQRGNLVRIDPQANRIAQRFALGGQAGSVVVADGVAWVAGRGDDSLKRVDIRTGEVRSIALGVGANPMAVALGEGSVWVAELYRGAVVRIDPEAGRIVATIPIDGGPDGITVASGSVWTANRFATTVSRIDTATLQVTRISTGHRVSGVIATGEASVWAGNQDGVLSRIDPRSGELLASIEVGSPDWPAMAVGQGHVWVSAPIDNAVLRVDVNAAVVDASLPSGKRPQGIAFDGTSLWVADYEGGALVKLRA